MNKKVKNKNEMSKTKVAFLGIFSVIALTAFVVMSFLLVNVIMKINGDLIINLDEYKNNQNQTSFIYATDSEGKTVEIARLHGEENRVWVDLDDMSPYMAKAFIALEDKRFEEHNGVDWIRTVGVIVKPKNIGQGGSTITQQLIKNLTNNKEVTFVRKFNEIITALNLEENYEKEPIIEAYLNTLYLGSGCYGVKTASEKYFGKDIADLNAAECAVIASITQAPTKYNPLLNPEENRKRQVECLEKMFDSGFLTQEELNEAKEFKLIFTNSDDYVPSPEMEQTVAKQEDDVINSFYVDYVIQCVRDDLMEEYGYSKQQATDQIYYGGLKIYAAVDLDVQESLEDVYVNRKGFPELKSDKTGDLVQSAMTIMDYNGRVVAIVGQAGEKTQNRGLNRAANSFRQPGSTIKPLATYAPAIEMNIYNYSSMILDYALAYKGELWPHNVDKTLGSNKNVTVEYAIQESLNTVPARVIYNDVGIDNSFAFLRDRFHLSQLDETKDRDLSPLATGGLTNGTTTVEMAAAYATFGNGGLYYEPYCYYKVTNSQGTQILLSNETPRYQRAISEETSDVVCELLQTVNTSYYGTASTVRKFPIMAKTGTTSSDRDRWFCAGTPYYVAAVWVGFDIEEPLGVSVNPGGKIFFRVFDKIHEGLADKDFPKSSRTVEKTYCRVTGQLAGSNCYSVGKGWYKITALPPVCTTCTAADKLLNTPGTTPGATVGDITEDLGEILNGIINDR